MCSNFFYKTFSFLNMILSLLFFSAFASGADIKVEGRVFTESGPLEKAKVYVYKSYNDIVEKRPLLISGRSDVQGFYRFQLESGEYYFTAKGIDGSKSFFAYHGSNPINVSSENIWISFMANEEKVPEYSDGVTSLKGIVLFKGKPVQGAHVAIYTLDARKFKGFGFLADKGLGFMKAVDEDGTFNFPLPANKYVVIARKMVGGMGIRPLSKNDLYCYASTNPIEVRADTTVRIEVSCYPKGDRLAFVNTPKIKTNDYLTIDKADAGNKYGIKGKVMDVNGAPLQGIYVIAYRTQDSSTPTHEAENIAKTDTDGNYFISLETDGRYGLVVRETLGGAPKGNDISGLYNEDDPWHGIYFNAGKLVENINIYIKKEQMKLFVN